jgi:hypothetical protein
MTRYAANLLFEYRIKEAPSRRPLCERRIIVLRAAGARNAIRRAKARGKQGEHSYRNADDQTVQIKFIGLVDVIDLDACEEDEVYYSLRRTSNPTQHVRPDDRLSAVTSESRVIGSSWWAVPKRLVAPKAPAGRRRT